MTKESDRRWLLVYDGQCDLCVRSAQVVRSFDEDDEIEAVPVKQALDRSRAEGVSEKELRESFNLFHPDGRRWAGSEAIPVLAELLFGPAAEVPFRSEPVRRAMAAMYHWVTEHRYELSKGVPST